MTREALFVMVKLTSRADQVAESIEVEPLSFGARATVGLYLMVPVRNEQEAQAIAVKLRP